MNEFGIKGGQELAAFLDQLPDKLVRNVLRGGLRAGAREIAKEAKAGIHSISGELARGVKVATATVKGQARAYVRLRGKAAYIGRFVEYGTAPHIIRAKGAKASIRTLNEMDARGSLVIGGRFVGSVVRHPGAKAKPFLRPALDRKAAAAVNAAGEYIARRLKIGDIQAPTLESDDFI